MTRPYTRACRQTNFSEGGFVNKVPFLFNFFYLCFFLLSLRFLTVFFFALLSFSKWVHGQLGGIHLITQGQWVVEFRLIIAKMILEL